MSLPLIAYRVSGDASMRIVPADREREWMDRTHLGFANRCLPLKLANEAGWMLLNGRSFTATWTGGEGRGDVILSHPEGDEASVHSHFGHGIVTFRIPYLFRTPPGWNLAVRGPTNSPKDGACALDGLVETDWAVATFTMNWKLTRPGMPVVFREDEPVCMIAPQRRGDLSLFSPAHRALADDPELEGAHGEWLESRRRFNEQLNVAGSAEASLGWQRHYFRGRTTGGIAAAEHQLRLKLPPFANPA